jgi:hypothetical protein
VDRVRQFVRDFMHDPLGKAIEAAVYLVLLAVAASILIYVGRWAVEFVRQAAAG